MSPSQNTMSTFFPPPPPPANYRTGKIAAPGSPRPYSATDRHTAAFRCTFTHACSGTRARSMICLLEPPSTHADCCCCWCFCYCCCCCCCSLSPVPCQSFSTATTLKAMFVHATTSSLRSLLRLGLGISVSRTEKFRCRPLCRNAARTVGLVPCSFSVGPGWVVLYFSSSQRAICSPPSNEPVYFDTWHHFPQKLSFSGLRAVILRFARSFNVRYPVLP